MKMIKKVWNNNTVRDTLEALGGMAAIGTVLTVLGYILYIVTNM